MPFVETCMDLKTVILSKVKQKKKDQHHMILESKKMKQIKLFTNRFTDVGKDNLLKNILGARKWGRIN